MELYPKMTALDMPVKQKLIGVGKIWGICFLLFMGAAILLMAPASLILKTLLHIDIAKTNQLPKMLTSLGEKLLVIPLIVPLLEETLFRLWQDYKVKHILIATVLFVTMLSIKIIQPANHLYKYIFEGLLALLIIFLVLKKGFADRQLHVPFKTRKIIFYIVAVLFGLVHIVNFSPLYPNIWYIYPIFVLPQIIMGFGFGYVRLKYGFFYGFLLHFMINLVFVLFHL